MRLLLSTIIVLFSAVAFSDEALIEWNSIHHPIKSDGGMVASQEHRASKIAAEILAQGGNAIDAAVALGFAKAVTLPKAGNLGGGGFMLVHLAKENKTIAIDYREMAPAAATEDMFLNKLGKVSLTDSRFSTQSSGVPGTVAGLLHALEKYGTLSREQVMAPAIRLAEEGIIADYPFLESLDARKIRLKQDDEVKRIYFKANGHSYRPGEKMTFPDLAKTLKLIKDKGRDGFYKGETAELFARYMAENDGLITQSDMANYKAVERQAVEGSYRGFKVVSMPPPSSGGIHIIQALNILENFNLNEMGWGSADHIHLMAEVFKYIYADRSKHLGDPDYYPVPVEQLIDKQYAKKLAGKINLKKATPSTEIGPSSFDDKESRQTTHFSVIDQWGNVVSNTYTLNFSFGSGKIVPGTGVWLNNEMDDFSAKPGVANAYGLVGGKANAIEPGKRPLSSMTPTIVFKDELPILITGSPGGSRIITTVMHQIVNTIDFKLNVAESANRPRFHHQWYPDKLFMENGFSPDTIKILENRGQNIATSRAGGSVQSISKLEKDKVYGASDPRRSGAQTIGVMKSNKLIVH